jgi:hypothetical protein
MVAVDSGSAADKSFAETGAAGIQLDRRKSDGERRKPPPASRTIEETHFRTAAQLN